MEKPPTKTTFYLDRDLFAIPINISGDIHNESKHNQQANRARQESHILQLQQHIQIGID